MSNVRLCRDDEFAAIRSIVNAAAERYRGVIPPDRWHEPYMSTTELSRDIAAGVRFFGYETDDQLLGVMGIQPVKDVALVRHAYVLPTHQRQGVGAALLERVRREFTGRVLIGTWAAANWAIDFYRRNGFELVSPQRAPELLTTYWSVPARQIETSVVLVERPVASGLLVGRELPTEPRTNQIDGKSGLRR